MTNETEAHALRVAREWLDNLEYSYVYEDEEIPENYWGDVYDTILDRVKVVLND